MSGSQLSSLTGGSSGGTSFAKSMTKPAPGSTMSLPPGIDVNMANQLMRQYYKGNGNEADMIDNAAEPTAGAPGGSTTAPVNPLNIPRPGNFIGRPYNQTYGGFPAPYADDGAQIEDTRRMTQNGAGRFGANSAARYGFGGGSFWQPDAMTPGQPAPQSPFQPRPPMTPPAQPQPGAAPPSNLQPPQIAPKAAPQNQMATFQAAIKSDPWLASQMLSKDPAFWMQNRAAITQLMGGDESKFRNTHDSMTGSGNYIMNDAQNAALAAFGRK